MQRLLNLGGTQKKGVVGSGKKRRPLGSKRAALWETCDDNMNKIGEYAILLSKGLGAMLTMEAVAMACCTIISIFLVSRQVLDITFEVEFAIFAAGCIFPLTFNVGAAFNRREAALECLSNLKANIFAIYFHFSSFDLTGTGKAEEDALHIFQRLVSNIETHLRGSREDHAGLVWGDTSPIQLEYLGENSGSFKCQNIHRLAGHKTYDEFVLLGMHLQRMNFTNFGYQDSAFKDVSVCPAITRTWHHLNDTITAYEVLKAIRFSSTSVALQYFSYALINTSCIMLAPYWASFCKTQVFGSRQSGGLADDLGLGPYASSKVWQVEEFGAGYGCFSAYSLGLFFTFIVFTLYQVQKDLDDPFDGVGQDDIRWETWRTELQHLGRHGPSGPEVRQIHCVEAAFENVRSQPAPILPPPRSIPVGHVSTQAYYDDNDGD